jgi:subtilisin family serine protease
VWRPARDVPEILVAAAACPAIDGGQELRAGPACGEGEMADYSSEGPAVDVAAPIAGIWAARYPQSGASQGEIAIPPPGLSDPAATASNRIFYGKFGGTSAAAPFVSGVVALMLEANPALTPAQIRTIVEDTAHDSGPPGWDKEWGHGEVRALAAVQAALALRAPAPTPAAPAATDELPATGDAPFTTLALVAAVAAIALHRVRDRLGTLR